MRNTRGTIPGLAFFHCPCRLVCRTAIYMVSINKGVAKEECGNPGPACLLQYLTSLPHSPAVSGGKEPFPNFRCRSLIYIAIYRLHKALQKGGVPAAPSGTATLLRLSPNHQFCPRPTLAVTDFRHPRLSWLDGRCVQGPGTYSPRHG